MRFLPALVIALLGLGFTPVSKAAEGLPGMLSKLHDECMEKQSSTEKTATKEFLLDSSAMNKLMLQNQRIPDSISRSRDIHQAEIELEKTKCLHSALESMSFFGVTIQTMEAGMGYRKLMNQLALYQGHKQAELERVNAEGCANEAILEEQLLCLERLQRKFVAERSMLTAVNSFLKSYEIEAEKRPQISVGKVLVKVENEIVRYIDKLKAEHLSPAGDPVKARPDEAPAGSVR